MNRIPVTDYFGGIEANLTQLIVTSLASAGLLIVGYAFRDYKLRSVRFFEGLKRSSVDSFSIG